MRMNPDRDYDRVAYVRMVAQERLNATRKEFENSQRSAWERGCAERGHVVDNYGDVTVTDDWGNPVGSYSYPETSFRVNEEMYL